VLGWRAPTRKNQPNFPEPSSSFASGCSRCHRNTYTFDAQNAKWNQMVAAIVDDALGVIPSYEDGEGLPWRCIP